MLLAKKQRLGLKLEGAGLGEHPKNLGPLHICATVEASNLKCGTQIGFGTSLAKKQHLRPKMEGVWARGTSKKNWDPLLISATVGASNFKFGMQLGFGTSLPKNNV